jgi:8-amino-7-oxononanoate synthase
MWSELENRLAELKKSGLHRSLARWDGISFAHNDYLGLSTHPAILEAGKKALTDFGAGSRGSRLLGGNLSLHEATEDKIAAFFGSPAAVLFSTGYMANIAAVTALGEIAETLVCDEKIHASLIDGVRLSGKRKWICPHDRWDLVPEEYQNEKTLFIAESLYSMDGDVVDWESLDRLQRKSGAFLLLDEAHAAGVFSEGGKGISAGSRDWDRMAMVVTFGKAFGVSGGCILGSTLLREWIVNRARPFIYTTAPSPVVSAMIGEAVTVVERSDGLREELWKRSELTRNILSQVAPSLVEKKSRWSHLSPVIPLIIQGEDRALRFAQSMRESGVDLRAIRYPTVPRGEERIRLSIHLGVSERDTVRMANEVVKRWTES